MTERNPVQWPGQAYEADGDDLAAPLQRLLIVLNMLEDPKDPAPTVTATPLSYQAITSGATSLGKLWALVVTGLGGAGTVTSLVAGLGYNDTNTIEAAVFTASAAVLLSATVLAVAMMVKADIVGRADATAAQYNARASIASALVASAHYNIPIPPELPAPRTNYVVKPRGDDNWYAVREFVHEGNTVSVVTTAGTPYPSSSIEGLQTTENWPKP